MNPDVTVALIAAGATLLVGLLGAGVGALFAARNEHRRWLREQRLESYTETLHLAAALSFGRDLNISELNEKARRSGAQLRLLAPRTTFAAGSALIRASEEAMRADDSSRPAAKQLVRDKRVAFAREAQKDLNTQPTRLSVLVDRARGRNPARVREETTAREES